ncbi:hypothetical protein L1987_21622 [Smallanthus sonchifolius]|uniref:Uncharacterized protein n=1 Tax=Smallanthus sonchifolius TaxID=185202 RepID=A0ACB9IF71_9ASTR|nr:hypothetical protein L1987_21622 [Smallanthus sonchifolius]
MDCVFVGKLLTFLEYCNLFCGSESGQMFSGVGFMWPIMMVVSSALQDGATIIKSIAGCFLNVGPSSYGNILKF